MHIPGSTYRLQFNKDFTFNNAAEIIEYLKELGITDVYASPILKAKKGSMHGYDITEPNLLNPELGTDEDFELLIAELKKNNLCWVQDIVPNHMAYNHQNQMLIDLLENGENSRFYDFFDIEWDHPHASVRGRILAPFLGKYYQESLEGGEIKLSYDKEGFSINYYETRLPLNMESYSDVLSYRLDKLRHKLGKNDPDVIKYQGILYVLKSLPSAEELDERYDQIKFTKGLLWELHNTNEEIRVFINENLKFYNGIPGSRESFDMLDKLLSKQYFRLCFWKVANEEINYRRFFNISELISLKIENEETFNRIHSLIFKLLKDEKIQGLRIDHVDGLYDPTGYLQKLRERGSNNYIVVEKILELNEKLPTEWPVHGTTGYEFLNYLNGIFCKARNEAVLTGIYSSFIKGSISFEQLVYDKKNLILKTRMAGEVERLAIMVEKISSQDRYGIDITMHGLNEALEMLLTYFPIYRTYINSDKVTKRDRQYIEETLRISLKKNPRYTTEINYIGNLLLMKFGDHFTSEQKQRSLDFIMKFQQLTGPLMAKGFEDTALYIYNRFITHNEVGGNPGKFGISMQEFHKYNKDKFNNWPNTMNATSTHDTKRGEDVRARINVISEFPKEWEAFVKRWSRMNAGFKTKTEKGMYPDRNDEYAVYQTIMGSYPFVKEDLVSYTDRIKEFVIKASREAKVNSAWVMPNAEYENAFTNFVEKILDRNGNNEFLEDFRKFHDKAAHYGMFNSLSQTIIKLAAPGVPDIYQGSELWNFSLVDPDNRRPVDYELRRNYLREIAGLNKENLNEYIDDIMKSMKDGRVKLFLITRILKYRNTNPELFSSGKYTALEVTGKMKNNIFAFARVLGGKAVVVIAPRLYSELIEEGDTQFSEGVWGDTAVNLPFEIMNGRNELTGESIGNGSIIPIENVLKLLPVGFISGEGEQNN